MGRILDTDMVAAMTGVKTRTVRGWARARLIPARRVGKRYLIPEAELLRFLAGQSTLESEPAAAGGR